MTTNELRLVMDALDYSISRFEDDADGSDLALMYEARDIIAEEIGNKAYYDTRRVPNMLTDDDELDFNS